MGIFNLFDLFRRKRVPALPEGTKERTSENVKVTRSDKLAGIRVDTSSLPPVITDNNLVLDLNSETHIFSSTKDGVLTYTFGRNNVSGSRIELAELSSDDLNQKGIEYLKEIARAIDAALNMPLAAKPDELNSAKLSAKARLEGLVYNHPGLTLNSTIFSAVNHMRYDILKTKDELVSNNGINYRLLASAVPKTVDISSCSPVELRFLGGILESRLTTLNGLEDVEAVSGKEKSISEFMRSQETPQPIDKVLSLLGDNIESSELPVILKYAKALEDKPNEDGLLYSAYLKLEENRIIEQIQREISEYQESLPIADVGDVDYAEAQAQINYLESLKTKPYPNDPNQNSSDKFGVIDFMVKTIQGKHLEDYISTGMKYDVAFRDFLKKCPIPHQAEALEYSGARLSCLGQVSNIPDENRKSSYPTLRKFIETTDCKDPDDKASKEFLFVMAQTEKDYIVDNYSPILDAYKKITHVQSK